MSVDCASSAILKGLVLMQTVHNNFIKERMNQKSLGRPRRPRYRRKDADLYERIRGTGSRIRKRRR